MTEIFSDNQEEWAASAGQTGVEVPCLVSALEILGWGSQLQVSLSVSDKVGLKPQEKKTKSRRKF